jgi:hypothetical protein
MEKDFKENFGDELSNDNLKMIIRMKPSAIFFREQPSIGLLAL